MQNSWGLAPFSKLEGDYGSNLTAAEKPASWRCKYHGMNRKDSRNRRVESARTYSDTEDSMEKWPNAFGGAEIKCVSRTLKQEVVILKLPWRHQDVEMLELCVTCSGNCFKGIKPLKEKVLCFSEQNRKELQIRRMHWHQSWTCRILRILSWLLFFYRSRISLQWPLRMVMCILLIWRHVMCFLFMKIYVISISW